MKNNRNGKTIRFSDFSEFSDFSDFSEFSTGYLISKCSILNGSEG